MTEFDDGFDEPDAPRVSLVRRARDAVSSTVTRRDVLVAGLVTVVAAGAGSAVAAVDPWDPEDGRPRPPQQLIDALTAERALIARIDASIAANPSLRRTLTGIRADHAAHAAAITDALRTFPNYSVKAGSKAKPATGARV